MEALEKTILKSKLILEMVTQMLGGDDAKAMIWLKTPNVDFGGSTPDDLIRNGRGHKVLNYLQSLKLVD